MLLMLQVLFFGRVFEYQDCGPVLESGGGIFPGGASGKQHAHQFRRHKRHGLDPASGRSPGGGHGDPLQYSCLQNPTDRGS